VAVRSKLVRPDSVLDTEEGQLPFVSNQAFFEAVMDAATTAAFAGGNFRVVTQRRKTGIPNEAVTVAAWVEWESHTRAKPQPEDTIDPDPLVEEMERQAELDTAGIAEAAAAASPDGLDESALPEEDDTAVPEPSR
jgi:hypothetical protein